jgi:hypothetical protein
VNCKKGDTAMYVGREYPHAQGQVFRCLSWITDLQGRSGWMTDPPPPVKGMRGFADAVLQPIRHPGDDAVDEMVQRCGKPGAPTRSMSMRASIDGETWKYEPGNGWRKLS